jgi:hypothetical protein
MSKKPSKKINSKNAKQRGGVMQEKEFNEIIQRIVRVKPKQTK